MSFLYKIQNMSETGFETLLLESSKLKFETVVEVCTKATMPQTYFRSFHYF